MLQFFRKYQNSLLVFMTILIIFSFVFSGVSSAAFISSRKKPVVVATTWNKQSVTKQELEKWVDFISREKNADSFHHINIFNDGILVKDLFETKVFAKLFAENAKEYSLHYEALWKNIRDYQFYQHPHIPELSSKAIWKSFSPEIVQILDALPESFDEKAFSLLLRLYQLQEKFPAKMLKSTLHYYEQQALLPKDPHLLERNLSLFGFHSAQDWFPKKLLEDACLFLINTSQFAKQEGVFLDKASLQHLLYERLASQVEEHKVEDLMRRQMQLLDLEQKQLFAILHCVHNARNYRKSLAKSVWMDPSFLSSIKEETNAFVPVLQYSMAPQFCFHNSLDYAYFTLYKMAVSPDSTKEIQTYFPVATVEKKYPEFVYQNCNLEVSSVSLEECASAIFLRDIWSWQLTDKGFLAILKAFPEIPGVACITQKQRKNLLSSLDPGMQKQVNAFSKREMVPTLPALIAKRLDQQKPSFIEVKLFSDGNIAGIDIANKKQLYTLLQEAFLQDNVDTKKRESAVAKLLTFQNGDQGFLRIQIKDKPEDKKIITYLDAKNLQIVDKLFEQQKKEMQPILEKTHPQLFAQESTEEEKKQGFAKIAFPCHDKSAYFTQWINAKKEDAASFVYENSLEKQFYFVSSENTVPAKNKNSEFCTIHHDPFPVVYQPLEKQQKDPYQTPEYLQLKERLTKEVEQEAFLTLLEKFREKQLFAH